MGSVTACFDNLLMNLACHHAPESGHRFSGHPDRGFALPVRGSRTGAYCVNFHVAGSG